MKKRLLLIMNPCAGMKRANKYLANMISLFSSYGYENVVYMTAAKGDGILLAKNNFQSADLIVCVGGDGTFSEVIMGMMESGIKKPVGYIPAGSTNDLANSLKLSKNIMQAARDIMEGTPKFYDVGSFNGRTFCYIASFGAFTKASYTTSQNAKNSLGHLAYVFEGMLDLPNIKSTHLRVEANGIIYEDDYVFGAISNATSIGGILTMDSEIVKMNDGLLEIMLIKFPQNAVELSRIMLSLNNQQYDPEMISFCITGEAIIYASKEIHWTLDGEYEEGSDIIEVKVIHNAMQLITNTKRQKPHTAKLK